MFIHWQSACAVAAMTSILEVTNFFFSFAPIYQIYRIDISVIELLLCLGVFCLSVQVVNRHPPFGNRLHEAAVHLPVYSLAIQQVNHLN